MYSFAILQQRAWFVLAVLATFCLQVHTAKAADFRAGCAAIDVSPRVLPAIRNGGFLEATSNRVDDLLHARCLVLADDHLTLAIVVVDSCMIPRDICDKIKIRAEAATGIPANRILIAATHTHSAPSLMDFCLGARQDAAYVEYFVPRVAEGIAKAHALLAPAKAGWSKTSAPEHTHCRRWLVRPEHTALDPFGDKTVRAMMHPGYQNPTYLSPSGPVDADLTLFSIQTMDSQPLAVLANFSMHYFGHGDGFSADYFGEFAGYLESKLRRDGATPFVGIMSQGTSGDLHWMDYSRPMRANYSRQQYAQELGDLAEAALNQVAYRSDISLAMAESTLTLARRQPSPKRIEWAAAINCQRGERRPQNLPEVYAEQVIWIRDHPTAELVLQAARLGELGIAAIPNEVFSITGLRLKAQSPVRPLMNMELANGAEGYIPPREQHFLGGYTTWPARSAGLAVDAESKIVAALLDLLEQVSSGKRRPAPLNEDHYTVEQLTAQMKAEADDNNRENRGAALTTD